ncbi:MAG: ATP-binding cassette domain-containing protein [Clostridia bacterium]|nr:ATP-binding cassette domain-containing protein [Clostridia bacterium]
MIEVTHLVKRYGAHEAVSDLSFTIEKGRIYGFLGPNGAGKSTTMNIITGCLAATSGEVKIGGFDIFEQPEQAKRLIGYLPEIPPLYVDMTPAEYLDLVARLKKVPASRRGEEIGQAMAKTGVEPVKGRLIRNLSKGYRQRVGIAQAILGNPEVVILDEPTVGLDPAQIIEIRDLIRELGQEHTVILSSHILTEVNQVCDHVMIIAHGRLVASDTPENLRARFAGEDVLRLTLAAQGAEAWLGEIPGVASVRGVPGDEGARYELNMAQGVDVREAVFRQCVAHDAPILEMARERGSLEDVFMELTQDRGGEGLAAGDAAEERKAGDPA